MSIEKGHSNGNGHATTRTPGIAEVRGPLGIGSASLAGKVALVTGSGEYQTP
jgi:tetrahydroxynaphthalene reductase